MTTDPATPKIRDLAARLVAHEAAIDGSVGDETPASFRVCKKLCQPLTALAGSASFRSLLTRALVIAQRENLSLSDVRVTGDGSLEDQNQERHGNDALDKSEQAEEGGVLLVAQLLGLLHIFIGEAITLRLVRDVWPNVSIYRVEFREDGQA